MPATIELRIFADPQALAEAGAELFRRLADEAVQQRGRFMVALSGGSTPRALFGLIASQPYRDQIDWGRVHAFWSDERAVPPDDGQSNYRMAHESLLERVPIPAAQVHRMPAERTPLADAADEYADEIVRVFGSAGTPRFDLVMLGMGDDGHTASLFPETEGLREQHRLVVPNYVPKLDANRMTFTPVLINAAAGVLFLIAGAAKADALHAVLEGPREPRRYPAQLVSPADGALHWYVDEAAGAKLQRRSF